MKNFLVIRFSSLGDAALAVPVLRAVCSQNPGIQITLLTRKNYQLLFKNIPSLSFVDPDLYGKHKGVIGLYRLYKEIQAQKKIDALIDLHNVVRSLILSFFFKISGVKIYKIDKGRAEKKALTRAEHKIRKPLLHTTERYAEVFRKAGLKVDLKLIRQEKKALPLSEVSKAIAGEKKQTWLGIAPFAQHQPKMYPIDKMKVVIQKLSEQGIKIFLFGGGKEEQLIAEEIADGRQVVSLVGRFAMEDELALMSHMDLMVTMDSANMHLASLAGTKIISIWGATHSSAGFAPFGEEDPQQMIQVSMDELACRPCSVFGNRPCFRKDLACMNSISPEILIHKIRSNLF